MGISNSAVWHRWPSKFSASLKGSRLGKWRNSLSLLRYRLESLPIKEAKGHPETLGEVMKPMGKGKEPLNVKNLEKMGEDNTSQRENTERGREKRQENSLSG